MIIKDKLLNHQSLDYEKVLMARIMTVMSVMLFMLGIILDHFSTVDGYGEIQRIRFIICCVLATVFVTSIKQEFFLKHYNYFCGGMFFCTAFAVTMMIYHTGENEIARYTYFAGLMLILVSVFSGTYIDTISSVVISVLMIATFILMTHIDSKAHSTPLLANNLFFLISSVCIGIISNTMRNRFLMEKIHLQDRLKESLRETSELVSEKTILANMDSLTNIPNKRHSRKILAKMKEDADKLDMIMTIMFVDLDKFKHINDTYGHNVGDSVLTISANRLDALMRKSDLVSRQGGDEFLIAVLVDKDNIDYVQRLENKIVETLTKPMVIDGVRLGVGASVGHSLYPLHGNNIPALIEVADHKMYTSKRNSKEEQETNSVSYEGNVTSIKIKKENKQM